MLDRFATDGALAVLCGGSAIGFRLLAQTTTIPGVEVFSNVTAIGIVAFLVWHTLTRTIPAIQQTFRDEQAETRKDQQAERQLFRETIDKILERLDD